jgi:hypothetical protein
MTDRRRRARRNLVLFWLVVIGTPILVVAGCYLAVVARVQGP